MNFINHIPMTWQFWAPILLVFVIIAVAVLSTAFIVKQQEAAIIERFGRFVRAAKAGLHFRWPLIERVAGRVNLRVDQLDVPVETKTQDDVFVHLTVSVQYGVKEDKAFEAFYSLRNSEQQITSYVFDVVRARVPGIKLDDVFEKKSEIADAIESELSQTMNAFGYNILKALVTDIEPDARVKAAMNEINEALRQRQAASERGEADRILRVKAAEAEAQSKALQGKGIADQRKAIVDGLRDSVTDFQGSVPGATTQDVMQLVLMTQYFDTLKEIGASSDTNTILLPHSPGGLSDIVSQVRDAIISASQVPAARSKEKVDA